MSLSVLAAQSPGMDRSSQRLADALHEWGPGRDSVEALQAAARHRRLRVPPEQAGRQILAASTGVVFTLITQLPDKVDFALSNQVRDAILDAVTTTLRRERKASSANGVAASAIALTAALDDEPDALSPAERTLLRDWLTRLSAREPARRPPATRAAARS
jgi:hypothetical protein